MYTLTEIIVSLFAVIGVIASIYFGIKNMMSLRSELRIKNIESFLKDVCIYMLSEPTFICEPENEKEKEIKTRQEVLKNMFKNTQFYAPTRGFLGIMYNLYFTKSCLEPDKYFTDGYYYHQRIKDFNFEWEFLFELFREYEYLIGLKESSIGEFKLSRYHNRIRKRKYKKKRKKILDRESERYKKWEKYMEENTSQSFIKLLT